MDSDREPDNASWVFDSLVGFLHGPIWNVPLQTFIEEKSLPFEPTENGEVSDKPEYKAIHEDYRNLVDMMLGSFMEDIGITAEQFEHACHMSRRELEGLPLQFHRRLFEQVWAANDYAMFVKMMTHKNVELQLQALELIERRFGALPFIFTQDDSYQYTGNDDRQPTDDEVRQWAEEKDDIMNEIKKLQLSDESDNEDVVNAPGSTKVDVVAEKRLLKSKLNSVEKSVSFDKNILVIEPTAATSAQNVAADTNDNTPLKQKVSEEELQQRQEYLKRQRDKLLSLKRQVREKQLAGGDGESGGVAGAQARPASARAAHAALSGRGGAPPDSAMQLRRALVDRLKAEVVDGNN